jgi:uncharacterized protein (TIGR01777 family)
MKRKIVLAGGTGFIGKGLIRYLGEKDFDFVVLTRNPQKRTDNVKEVYWDAKNLGPWTRELENADVLVNLTGKSVNCRYTEANKREIINSRTQSTGVLGTAMLQLKQPPKVWINSSSATIYRHAEDRNMDELTGEYGNDFSPGVVKAWEKSFNDITLPATKKFTLRISIVLGKGDGVMPRLINLVRFGLGGKQGNGAQFFSWIHEEDFYRIILWCIDNPEQQGVYNCCVPNPITNYYLMRILRETMNMPFGLPAPGWLLKMGAVMIGTETELILKSRRVVPTKLIQQGFVFTYPEINSALKNLFST